MHEQNLVADMVVNLFLLAVFAVLAVIPARMARDKGHSFWGFYALGWLLSPFLSFLIVYLMKPAASALVAQGKMRRCPECAEVIQREAKRCPHCAASVKPLPPVRKPDEPYERPAMTAQRRAELEAKLAAAKRNGQAHGVV